MVKNLLANRYKIIEKIGEGGMGIIWRVYDTVEQREVALKQFYKKEQSEDSKMQKRVSLSTISTKSTEAALRFKQEFRTMVKLKHPNTVNVYDYGVLENGEDYITMEFVSGEELSDILKEGQLSFPEIYRILIQTAQVLNFIHSRLMVHRDIKPANIRITPEGNVKLMDFGLMAPMGLPSTGEITGTAIYLPPEVAQGGIIDARSDLYSLGVMAYELVTGKPPFAGEKTLDIIKQHIEKPPIPPHQIRKDVPEELEKIVLKLLAKDQNERYQTTAELINDLVRVAGEKISVETLEQRKSYLNCSELIGREREMQELKDRFSLTTQGKGQSIFVAAPAGVGKTRLIQEFKLKVQLAEVPFMEGMCFEQGMTSYQPLANAFRPVLPLTKKEVLDKYGSVLVKVMPELKRKGYEPAPELEEVGEKVRLFEQVTAWLKEVSKITPIVICIEDLHWSDFATLELLNSCIRELQDYPIMILGAFRDDEVEPTSIIFQTVEEGITQQMKLSTLNKNNVQSLIKGMLGRIELSEDFTDHVYTATAGNPFFVSETMRVLIEEEQLQLERGRWILPVEVSTLELPTSIEATILRRLKLFSPEALELARVAAVVGRGLDLSFLKELSGLEDEELFDILDELIERQFMEAEEKHYSFTHDRVRETLYGQLSEEERQKFHQQTGVILEKRHAENPDEIASELGYHFSRGLDKQKAVKYLLTAGEQAFAGGSFTDAYQIFSQGVNILDTIEYPNKDNLLIVYRDRIIETSYGTNPELCLETCRKQLYDLLYSKKYNIEKAIKIINIIFKIVNWVLPERVADKIRIKLATQSKAGTSHFGAHIEVKSDIGALVNLTARSMGYSVVALSFLGRVEECFKEIERFFRFFPDKESPVYTAIVLGTVIAYLMTGRCVEFASNLEHAKEVAERQEYKCVRERLNRRIDWYALALIYVFFEALSTWLGKKFNEQNIKKAMTICEEKNLIDVKFWIYKTIARWYSCSGSNKEYREILEKLMETSKKMGRPAPMEIYAYEYMIRFAIDQHDFVTAEKWNSKFHYTSTKLDNQFFVTWSKIFSASLLFNKGKIDEAISTLKETIEVVRGHKFVIIVEALYRLGEIFLEINKTNEAEEMLKDALERNASFEMEDVFWAARIYRALGQVYKKKKEFEKAKEYFEKSLSIAEKEGYVLEAGKANLSICELCMDLTQYSSAKQALQNAKRRFQEADSKYFLDKADRLETILSTE